MVAASASDPMPNPVDPKKCRRVIRCNSLSFISLFLRQGLIQVEEYVGQQDIGECSTIFAA